MPFIGLKAIFLLWLLLLTANVHLSAQNTDDKKNINGDSLFSAARDFAFSGSYDTSRLLLDTVIQNYPEYWDAHVLQIRTYAWEKKYDTALSNLLNVLDINENLTELRHFEPRLLFWMGRKEDALAMIEQLINEDAVLHAPMLELRKEIEQEEAIEIDPALKKARDLALNGSYDSSRILLDTLLKENPEYWDAHDLFIRTYAWEKKYDTALSILQNFLEENDSLTELKYLEPKLLHWMKRYEDALVKIDTLTSEDTVLIPQLIFLKASIQKDQEKYEDGLETINFLIEADSSKEEYEALKIELERLTMNQHIALIYGFDYFSNIPSDPRQSISLEYKYATKKNIFLARATYATRFGLNDLLLEVDDYLNLTDRLYVFGNFGFSPTAELYPRWRLGIEPYLMLGKGFEVSLGYRFLFFDNLTDTAKQNIKDLPNPRFGTENLQVHLFTASLSRYWNKNYLQLRGYLGRNNIDNIAVFETLYRRFFNKQRTYLELKVGLGNSPDEAYLESVFVDFQAFKSRYAVLGYGHEFSHKYYGKIWFIYDRQIPAGPRNFNIISGYIGIWKNF